MTEKHSVEAKKDARYRLMQSARSARQDGFSQEVWVKHPAILEMSSKYDLHPDILEHISAWVWTFRR